MKYPVNKAHGDAGEFYFAYKVASVLGWPCRLFDIDIGVDAQVEILDRDQNSTGKFVAFQIKTIAGDEKADCVYVKATQMTYWKEHATPVFVVLVDLAAKTMYLHCVSRAKEYPSTPGGRVRIDFNLEKDKFGARSARIIREGTDREILKELEEYLAGVHSAVESLLVSVGCDDIHQINDAGRGFDNGLELLRKADELISCHHLDSGKRVELHGELYDARDRLCEYVTSVNLNGSEMDEKALSSFLGSWRRGNGDSGY